MAEPKVGDELCGPYGPKFVGYGPAPKQPFLERWGATIAISGAIAFSSALIAAVL